MERFKVNAKSFKKMDDPVDMDSGKIKYVCYVQATSIPESFDNWMFTNPREQKMNTNVANKITGSLDENQNFHELNRGILMSVDSVEYDNKNGIVTITMDDPTKHGNIDGGHTLRAILDAKGRCDLSTDRYVFFELFTGIDSPVELAAARNTSVQVDLKSIEELQGSFDVIKDAFSSVEFAHRIAYKMNENMGLKPIDVREIIAITIMFSQTVYPFKTSSGTLSEQQPVQCYTGKEASLRKFLSLGVDKRNEMINCMAPIIPDIFKLWDKVERSFPDACNKSGRRYGTRKYSKFKNGDIVDNALFTDEGLEYSVPKGLMYPIVGAFRALVTIDAATNKYSWRTNPFDVWDALGSKLSGIVLDEKTDNPEVLAKNSNLWSNLFKEVYIHGYMS